MAYFFDSYGRRPSKVFNDFAHDMITISYYREQHNMNPTRPMRQVLSDENFTKEALSRCYTTKLANDQQDTCRYFPYQIQSDITNVCGEYSLIFLHNIVLCATPWLHAYDFFTHYPDAFYLVSGKVASQEKRQDNTGKHRLPKIQRHLLMNNDILIRNIVKKLYKGVHVSSTILE